MGEGMQTGGENLLARPLLKTEHPTCEEHEDEKINIYCVTCAVPTCSLCKVFGEHKECEVAPLSDIYMKQKVELTDGIGALVAANDRVQAYVGDLQDTCKNIEDNCKARKQALCEKFDRMCAILEERRKIMLQRIIYEQEQKSQHLKSLTKVCGDHIESSSKLVDAALQSMEEPQMAVFVQNAKVLIRKIAEMTQSCKPEALESGYDNMEHYTVEFNAEERVLYQLDFIKVEEPEAATEEEGAGGEAEDPLMESGAAAEDAEDFLAIGKEEQAQERPLSRAANGAETEAAPQGAARSGAEEAAGEEGKLWGAQQLDGEFQARGSDLPASPPLEGALQVNLPIQDWGQPKAEGAEEAFSVMDSSAETKEGAGLSSNGECEVGSALLLNGMASAASQGSASGPAADRWMREAITEPLLSSCFNPALWLHD